MIASFQLGPQFTSDITFKFSSGRVYWFRQTAQHYTAQPFNHYKRTIGPSVLTEWQE